MDVRWPLVERDAELAAFGRAWRTPGCRVVAVAGPAGVGKSRLADEMLARVQGHRAARVIATAASATVPLSALAHLIPGGADLSDPVAGFAHVTRLLAGERGRDRWVVLVDDLHLLDAASAALLRHVVDAGVARLIVTVRTGAPPSAAVQTLAWGDSAARIDVAAFDRPAVERLLRAVLGAPVTRPAAHRLFEASGGNALYLRELVHGAAGAGALTFDGEIWDLGAGALITTARLGELIAARLAAAPPSARRVLELLAVGEPVSLDQAAFVASPEVVAGLEEVGLIDVRPDGRRTLVVLSHPLYGEALRDELPVTRQRALLATQAAWIRRWGSRRHDDALHVARWSLAATGSADPALLYQAALLARHAQDFEQVRVLLDGIAEPDRTYASCLLHGDALVQLGRAEAADAMLAEAQRRAGTEPDRAAAALLRTWNLFWVAARTEDALRVNETARAELDSPVARRTLTLNEAALLTVSGRPVQGLALLDDLEPTVGDAPDVNAWIGAAMSRTAGLAYVGRSHEAIAWGWSAYETQLGVNDRTLGPADPTAQLIPVIFAATDAGDLAEAIRVADLVTTELLDNDAVQTRIWAAVYRGRAEWLAGDVRAARHWYAEAVAHGQRHRQVRPLFQAWAGLAAAAAVLGDLDNAEAALVQMRTNPFMGHQAGEERLGEAWLLAARGNPAAARDVLTRAARKAAATGQRTSEMLLLTDIARLGGAAGVVERLAILGADCEGSFAPARVNLARALAADDPAALLTVTGELGAIGAHLPAAEAAAAAAGRLRRDGRGRQANAAVRISREHAERCPGARTPLLAGTTAAGVLTAREREVAVLAAGNRRSRDIAEDMHLSVRTVDNHLQNAYAKLGVTSRRELAEALGW